MSTCQTCPTCHCSPRFTLLFLMYIFLVGVDVVQTVRSLGHVCMCKCTVDVYVKISYLSDLSYMYKCLMPPASPLYYGTVPRCYTVANLGDPARCASNQLKAWVGLIACPAHVRTAAAAAASSSSSSSSSTSTNIKNKWKDFEHHSPLWAQVISLAKPPMEFNTCCASARASGCRPGNFFVGFCTKGWIITQPMILSLFLTEFFGF